MVEQIITVSITFPIGAADHVHKGLIHFFEHYFLKAKYLNGKNLLDTLDSLAINVNAATSFHYLRLDLQTTEKNLMQVLQIIFDRLDSLKDEKKLDVKFINKEKALIFKEMEVSVERNGNNVENPILGNNQSVGLISGDEILKVGQIFNQLMPIMEITNGELTDSELSIIKSILMSKKLAVRKKNHRMYFNIKQSTCNETLLIDVFLTDPLRVLIESDNTIDQNIAEQIVRKQIVLSSKKKKAIRYVYKCQVDGYAIVSVKRNWVEEDEHIGAISFKLNDMLKKYRHSVQYVFKQYLVEKMGDAGSFRLTSESGAMTIFFQGTVEQIIHGLRLIINLDEVYIRDKLVHVGRKHYHSELKNMNDYALGSTDDQRNFDREKIIYFFKESVLNISVVTSIELEYIKKELAFRRKNVERQREEKKVDYVEKFSNLKKMSSQFVKHEYIQVFLGPDYFSKEKFISHVAWQMIDGISGELYKYFSVIETDFYSFKYFPRELVDGGYLVLYVFDKKGEINIVDRFFELIKELLSSFSEADFQAAKMKLLMSKQFSETVENQLLNLSLHSLYGYEFREYDDEVKSVSYTSVKIFLKKLLNVRTVAV